jgi:hypothetical protein
VVAADFLRDPEVRPWLDGIEPAWTLLTFDGLRALRQEPSAAQTTIQIANDLSADEIAGSAVADWREMRRGIATADITRLAGVLKRPFWSAIATPPC